MPRQAKRLQLKREPLDSTGGMPTYNYPSDAPVRSRFPRPLQPRVGSLRERLYFAPFAGVFFAVVAGVWAAIEYAASPGSLPQQTTLSLPALLALYLLAGQAGGLLWALCYPIIRWHGIGYVLLGVVTASPLYLGAAWFVPGAESLTARALVGAVSATVIGGLVGWSAWLDDRHKY